MSPSLELAESRGVASTESSASHHYTANVLDSSDTNVYSNCNLDGLTVGDVRILPADCSGGQASRPVRCAAGSRRLHPEPPASLLVPIRGLAASPAAAEDPVRPADPPLAQAFAAEQQAASAAAEEQGVTAAAEDSAAALDDQVTASDEMQGHRPPPGLAIFTGVVAIGRTRYTYTMVGSNPLLRRAQNVVVPVTIIPLRLEFHDGTVLDPTAPDSCLGGQVPLDVTLQSPLFQDYDYG